ncbi:MAG: helix-turn-helix transcriptional regulator [Desulfobacterales bacterium]|nr:helix-turn-helix transcriptional regulator [Desulfobacterales bacterium]
MKEMHDKKYHCYFELALLIIGGKWKSIILYHLGKAGILRYGELKKEMPNITEKMLTQQLKDLQKDNMVLRKMYNQVPPKVEYSLTPFGQTIMPALLKLREWGITYEKEFDLSRYYEGNEDYEQIDD